MMSSERREPHEGEAAMLDVTYALEHEINRIIEETGECKAIDKRALAVAKTNFEQAFMWMRKAIV